MTRTEIFDKLKEILEMAGGEVPESLNESTSLSADLGLNSVNVLYLVIAIEEMFGVEFDDTGINAYRTVGDVVNFIEAKLK